MSAYPNKVVKSALVSWRKMQIWDC